MAKCPNCSGRTIDLPDYKAYCPTCADYKLQTNQISPFASMFEDDDCGCVLPEQSCPSCRKEARKIHQEIEF